MRLSLQVSIVMQHMHTAALTNLGQNDDTALITFLTSTFGNAPSAASTTRFRRLFFEAHALCLEDLKSRADRFGVKRGKDHSTC